MDAPHVLTKNVSATAYDVRGGLAIDFAPRGAVSIDKSKMSASCTFTTSAVDRVGDCVETAGIVTTGHQLNPVVFWDHAKDLSFPIGKTKDPLGNYTVKLFDDYATQETFFSQTLLEAEQIFSLIDEGIVSANSIGFRPIKAKPLYAGNRRLGLHLLETELLEVSWVGVPCHPEAVRVALSRDKICGKSLADSIRRSLSPLASAAPAWSRGVTLKAVGDDDGPVDSPELGEEAERLDIMADIIGGLIARSRSTAKAWHRKNTSWDESKHPRADDGKFGSGHGGGAGKPSSSSSNAVAESKPGSKPSKPAKKPTAPKEPKERAKPSAPRAGGKQAQQAASKSIERILSGAITESSHKELVGHLEKLTVPQLNELRKQHGLKAEGRLKAQVIKKLSEHFNAKIVKQGTVDVDKVLTALKPYANVPLDRDMVRFAKADYYSIKQQYGTLTVHRIKELAVDAAKSLRELPAGATEDREHFKKRLAVCSWMAEQAKRDGIAGKVEPSDLHDFGKNTERIMLGEKLRGGKNGSPWSSFLIHGIRDEFDVDRSTNDEQIWANLKDPRGSRYKGPRLDAVLRRLRPDYGSMNQEQLFNVLPHLKERTDTFTPEVVARASRGRKSWAPMCKDLTGWDEHKHPRANDGKFGSGGGSSRGTADKPRSEAADSKTRREQATAKAREATHAALKVGLSAAIKVATTAGHFEHVAVDWITDKVASLPSPLRLPTIGVYKVSMATYAAGQKAVAAVAAERGNTPDQVERITKACGIANAIGAKALPLAFELLGAHGAGPWLSGFAPLGSIGYLAFATASNPMATLRAARKAVSGAITAVGLAKSQTTANEDMIGAMLDSLAAAKDPDLWMACYCVALDQTGDAAKSLDVVRKIFGGKSDARKVDGTKSLTKRSAKASKGAPMADDRHDDAPKTEVAGVPLGAKILRKLYSGLSSLADEVTKMSSELDACEAKEAIGSMVGGLGSTVSEIEKQWGKWYKDHDLAAQDEEPAEETVTKAEGEGEGDDDVDDVLEALDGLGDDEEGDDDDLTPEERQAAEKRIKALEQEITHLKRLQR